MLAKLRFFADGDTGSAEIAERVLLYGVVVMCLPECAVRLPVDQYLAVYTDIQYNFLLHWL